jgi:tetratricopeptide (TPR) repeat protein
MNNPTVFISYSQDSPEHCNRVLALSNRLRGEGIDCTLDQYEDSPPEGWPKWMDRHIENSDFVILICTETYYRRAMDKEQKGKGLGVRWESTLTYQHIYDAGGENSRFIPVLFQPNDAKYIPTPLGGSTHYCINSEDGYEDLYRRLTGQPKTTKPELGKLRALPPRERKPDFCTTSAKEPPRIQLAKLPSTSPDLFGRENELAQLHAAGDSPQTNIVSLVAWGGVGKTALVNKWLLQMRKDNYRGAERVYGWSFYSQGASEGKQVSADQFIASALEWFGDADPTRGSPWDKGERLAELVRRQRTLLIIDGLEPLQRPPGELGGRLKDPGLQSLLRELAYHNPGLCIITTRLKVDDLKEFDGTLMETIDLTNLSPEAGAELLKNFGVTGTDTELMEATKEFDGHALALTLLGSYLAVVYKGDIRQRDKVPKLMKEKRQGGHAIRVMESYERWFANKPELDILKIMGLFDRPAPSGAIEALKAKPAIEGLTTEVQKLSNEDWQYAVNNLRTARLLAPEDKNSPDTLDAHPLVREHFGEKLTNSNPAAWKEAHSRLYQYYKNSQPKEYPETLEGMTPLFAAVAHGCQAGRHQEAMNEIFYKRIDRGEAFVAHKLGAINAALATLSGFFDTPWRLPVGGLTEEYKAYVLNVAGYCLHALGRLSEAIDPMQAALTTQVALKNWRGAAIDASNFSDNWLTSGDLHNALKSARHSVELADRSRDNFTRIFTRIALANALHQAGGFREAKTMFRKAEDIQKEFQPNYPHLYALQRFYYCDFLLDQQKWLDVQNRGKQTLTWMENDPTASILTLAVEYLSLGQAYLLQAQQEKSHDFMQAEFHLDKAVEYLRRAGTQQHIPRGLLARAELCRLQRKFEPAQRDLDEAMTIAKRGGMRLHEADCYLEYARLYLAMGGNYKAKAQEHLAKTKAMINEMGYHRRDKDVKELEKQLMQGH